MQHDSLMVMGYPEVGSEDAAMIDKMTEPELDKYLHVALGVSEGDAEMNLRYSSDEDACVTLGSRIKRADSALLTTSVVDGNCLAGLMIPGTWGTVLMQTGRYASSGRNRPIAIARCVAKLHAARWRLGGGLLRGNDLPAMAAIKLVEARQDVRWLVCFTECLDATLLRMWRIVCLTFGLGDSNLRRILCVATSGPSMALATDGLSEILFLEPHMMVPARQPVFLIRYEDGSASWMDAWNAL